MTKIDKFNLHLNQLIINSTNLACENGEVVIGRLIENITFAKNDPLNLRINNKKPFECDIAIDSIQNFELQYIHRIHNTPYYVSYLSNDDFNLKIIDFYDWHPQTSIYRLFIFKNVAYKQAHDLLKINFNMDSNLIQESNDQIKINEVTLKISNDFVIDENNISTAISMKSDTFILGFILDYRNNAISSITLDMMIKKFHDLYNACKSSHISNYFITKNQKAEKELDDLWNTQKYILPDLSFEQQILYDKTQSEISKYWISNFYKYFSLGKTLKYNIENENIESAELLSFLPNKKQLLQDFDEFDINNEKLSTGIQEWWNAYSLPVFETVFSEKCLKQPEEVFTIYFLAIGLKLPWAPILLNKIESINDADSISPLHRFLFLLAYFYKRIFKNNDKNRNAIFSSGYFWDNNYKSIFNSEKKAKFEITKFSDDAYTNLNLDSDKYLKINKLCKVILKDKNTNISILPLINNANNQFKIINHLIIGIEQYKINLPLIWENGFIEFDNVKFKWILKKNRFQFTLHSSKKKGVQLNNDTMELNPTKKAVYYIEVSSIKSQLYINLFNRVGGTVFSQFSEQVFRVMASGFALTRFATLTNNILYSSGLRKHLLFDKKSDTSTILTSKNENKIKFFIKHTSASLDIPYIENVFMDKFFQLNKNSRAKLILLIDKKFADNLTIIQSFFRYNFGFRPEYMLVEKKSNIQLGSNLIIEFLFNNLAAKEEKIIFKDRNHIIFTSDSFESMINYLIDIFKNNMKN